MESPANDHNGYGRNRMSNVDIFEMYYTGLGGIGLWPLLFILAAGVYIYMWWDSGERSLPAREWKLAALLLPGLLLPTVIWRLANPEVQASLQSWRLWFLYLGLLGGVIPFIVGVGYYMNFQGVRRCVRGHMFDSSLTGTCPQCTRLDIVIPPPPPPSPPVKPPSPKTGTGWLVESGTNRRHDLCVGVTIIGRGREFCDIALADDSVSRNGHIQIRQQGNGYLLELLPNKSTVMLNGQKAPGKMLLQNGDYLTVGNTELQFVSNN